MDKKNINIQNLENYDSFEQSLETVISSSNLDNFDNNFSWFVSTFKEEDNYPIDTDWNV